MKQMREAFEASAKNKFPYLTFAKTIEGTYLSSSIEDMYQGFCLAALSAVPAQEPSENYRKLQIAFAHLQKEIIELSTKNAELQVINVLQAQQPAQEPVKQERWLPIETAPKGKKIIVSYKNACGKDRTVFAKYIEKFTEESSCDSEMDEYDEKTDTYYLKEGWVELIDNWDEFSSVYFDSRNVVTGWMPAPSVKEVTK